MSPRSLIVPVLALLVALLFGTPGVHGHIFMDTSPLPNQTSTCNSGVNLVWTSRVSSSIIATPRVVDIAQNGQKDIFISTFSHYVEALMGATGDDVPGFPFVHPKFKSYSSPLPIDVDGDGKMEWLIATYNGELLVFSEDGKTRGMYRIPALNIKKNWMNMKDATIQNLTSVRTAKPDVDPSLWNEILQSRGVKNLHDPQDAVREQQRRQLQQQRQQQRRRANPNAPIKPALWEEEEEADYYENGEAPDGDVGNTSEQDNLPGPNAHLSKEAIASMRLLFNPGMFTSAQDMEAEEYSFQVPELRQKMKTVGAEDEIMVDAHILSTPVLTDIDGNGDVDAVLHVSYFFDPADFRNGRRSLPEGINGDDYMATAVVCINLVTGEYRWVHVLHLSRKSDTYPTYGLSTPLVVNADEDQTLEIYVSSTTGALHSVTGTGVPRRGWPVWAGPMTGSPAAEDVSGDGKLDVCVGDVEGKMSCFSAEGKLLWETHLYGGVTTHVVFGDVNGDGNVDVVFGTSSGAVYALNGTDGQVLSNFPVITGGAIMAPPLLLRLQGIPSQSLHIIVPSHDGNLYFVGGMNGCIETVDIDEKSSTMVLADDLTGNGYLDLVVTTLRGGVYLFETQAAYSALSAWPSETKGLNCHTASDNNVGILIEDSFRKSKDIRGDHFKLPIFISDRRKSPAAQKRYMVEVFVGPRIRIFHGVFNEPKSYSLIVRAPLERMRATLMVTMTLTNGQTFTDSVALSFNLYFLETIKFTLIVPFLIVSLAIMVVHKRHEVVMSQQDELFY